MTSLASASETINDLRQRPMAPDPLLANIHCPTLIIAGSEDITVGREAAGELHEAIAHSELFVYEGLGHGLFEEAKDFYERVFAFFSR